MDYQDIFSSQTDRSNDTTTCQVMAVAALILLVCGGNLSTAQENCLDQLTARNEELATKILVDPVCGCSSLYVTRSGDASTLKDGDNHHVRCNDCPPWITVGNSTYMIPEGKRTFEDSRELCQDCGGDIAVLNTTDVRSTIEMVMNTIRDGERSIWIGILRVQPERVRFEWLDGRNFSVTDSSWDNGQPNDSPGVQDCVASFLQNSWKVEDKRCSDTYHALCQID